MPQPIYFDFETDFVSTLRCIPMIVRYKLDRCLIKLQLSHWAKFSREDKELMAALPCESAMEIGQYAVLVQSLVTKTGAPKANSLTHVEASWEDLNHIPTSVRKKAKEYNSICPTLVQWQSLTELERFALVKLSQSGHEAANFPKALQEFAIYCR
ncbi:nitrate reductase associated protein [Dyadobacter tibetensis]|uniref:nitrate reductase associated protein n=1 Tax=Dyadobacter tibetensis TaxID=1211851 RepID=UPI0004B3D2CB|nr:nitrate reductase associated protein [Dyadobacter tibetensis]